MTLAGYTLSARAAAAEARYAGGTTGPISNAVDSGAILTGDADIFEWLGGGGGRAAGVNVTPQTAMRTSAVWRCVTLISGALMVLPLGVYERTANAPIRLPDHEFVRFLQHEPNELMSGPEMIELEAMAVLLRGNGYALIQQARNGVIHDLEYYHPARVRPFKSGKALWYRFTNPDGTTEDHDAGQVIHFRGPGLDEQGLRALSPIEHHAHAIGIGLATRDYTAKQFDQGLLTNDFFSSENEMTSDQRSAFKEYLKRRAAGIANAHNPLILEKGMKWERMDITAKDAQLLELLQYSTIDIARIFGVPPHMIGEVSTSTSWGTGIEQQGIGFVRYTVLPHLVRFARELTRKLFPIVGAKVPKYYIDFDPEALMSGDAKAQGEYARLALGGNQLPGFMSRNEVRRSKGLPPIDNGDEVYWPNGNSAVPEPKPNPDPAPADTSKDPANA